MVFELMYAVPSWTKHSRLPCMAVVAVLVAVEVTVVVAVVPSDAVTVVVAVV